MQTKFMPIKFNKNAAMSNGIDKTLDVRARSLNEPTSRSWPGFTIDI
jgi:hypothetical protein